MYCKAAKLVQTCEVFTQATSQRHASWSAHISTDASAEELQQSRRDVRNLAQHTLAWLQTSAVLAVNQAMPFR